MDKGKVKVVDSKGASYKFENIEIVDGAYLGSGGPYNDLPYVITTSGSKTRLDSTQIEVVYLKDRKNLLPELFGLSFYLFLLPSFLQELLLT